MIKYAQPEIALFLPSFRGGGAERVMVNLANSFSEAGKSVAIVVAMEEGPYRLLVNEGIQIVNLNCQRVSKCLMPLAGYLRSSRPKCLLSTMEHSNIVAALANLLAGRSSRLYLREANTISRSWSAHGKAKTAALKNLMKVTYGTATGLVAPSLGVAEDVEQTLGLKPGKIKVIYNPIVTHELKEKAQDAINHAWFGSPNPVPVIVAIGRLTEQKGFPTLLKAMSLLQKNRQARLLILGEGEERPSLEKQIDILGLKDQVQMPGFVDNPFKYLRHADLFVLSSRWEGLPGTLIQAMACGCKVVSTDCPSGPKEILENGEWGTLVPVDDVQALANAMVDALSQPGPDVSRRAADFTDTRAAEQYLEWMGLPCPLTSQKAAI